MTAKEEYLARGFTEQEVELLKTPCSMLDRHSTSVVIALRDKFLGIIEEENKAFTAKKEAEKREKEIYEDVQIASEPV